MKYKDLILIIIAAITGCSAGQMYGNRIKQLTTVESKDVQARR